VYIKRNSERISAFRTQTDPDSGKDPVSTVESATAEETLEEEGWILCRQCRQRLTRPSHRVSINGSHRHSFANPSGIVFEIACYRKVQGYRIWGQPSREFAWFAGHSWEIVTCAKCSVHLGWLFSGDQASRFFGLILENLDENS
jgi:hypothetical protein